MAEKQPIIIKKIVKKSHGGHAGGSWKIAYADFVTALMAFFLLMWLLNVATKETKEQLAQYFQEFSIFTGAPSFPGVIDNGAGQDQPQADPQELRPEHALPDQSQGPSAEEILRDAMVEAIREQLSAYENEILVDAFDNGTRIQMIHSDGHPFFESASAKLTMSGRQVLKVIADTVREMPNKLAVEGHTDSKPLGGTSARYTNWELSTDRASSARLALEEFGIHPDRIFRVVGYAATQPLITEDTTDPRNRRVSILVFNSPDTTKAQPQDSWPHSTPSQASDPAAPTPQEIDDQLKLFPIR